MREIDAATAAGYLFETARVPAGAEVRVETLAWGVSNIVLRVSAERAVAGCAAGEGTSPAFADFILKQSRAQLRTPDPWFSRLDRIYREVDVLHTLGGILPQGTVPVVLFEDRANYLFAMTAAPRDHRVWKERLLHGEFDRAVAERLGRILGRVHAETARRFEMCDRFRDTTVFEELRIDPFYRRIAALFPEFEPTITRTISESLTRPCALVLADFSPKNVLVWDDGLMLVDFETGHAGDPAFDLGFFLSHLLLKAILHANRFDEMAALTEKFLAEYRIELAGFPTGHPLHLEALVPRVWRHLALCMWARIDGTSKVDYLTQAPQKEAAVRFAKSLLTHPPADWKAALSRLKSDTRSACVS